MKLTLDEQTPVLDMDIPVTLKVRDLIRLNQILARTYDEEERLRETLGPILQEIKTVIQEVEENPEWDTLHKWHSDLEWMVQSEKNQKKHLKRIKQALLKNRNLRIRYCSPGSTEITRRTIIPLELWESDSYWLLKAFCYLKGEEFTFRVDRILKVKEKSPGKKQVRLVNELDSDRDVPEDITETFSEELEPDDVEELISEQPENQEPTSEGEIPAPEAVVLDSRNRHYSLPGKKPHQPGLPNRLERLIKRVERKTPR